MCNLQILVGVALCVGYSCCAEEKRPHMDGRKLLRPVLYEEKKPRYRNPSNLRKNETTADILDRVRNSKIRINKRPLEFDDTIKMSSFENSHSKRPPIKNAISAELGFVESTDNKRVDYNKVIKPRLKKFTKTLRYSIATKHVKNLNFTINYYPETIDPLFNHRNKVFYKSLRLIFKIIARYMPFVKAVNFKHNCYFGSTTEGIDLSSLMMKFATYSRVPMLFSMQESMKSLTSNAQSAANMMMRRNPSGIFTTIIPDEFELGTLRYSKVVIGYKHLDLSKVAISPKQAVSALQNTSADVVSLKLTVGPGSYDPSDEILKPLRGKPVKRLTLTFEGGVGLDKNDAVFIADFISCFPDLVELNIEARVYPKSDLDNAYIVRAIPYPAKIEKLTLQVGRGNTYRLDLNLLAPFTYLRSLTTNGIEKNDCKLPIPLPLEEINVLKLDGLDMLLINTNLSSTMKFSVSPFNFPELLEILSKFKIENVEVKNRFQDCLGLFVDILSTRKFSSIPQGRSLTVKLDSPWKVTRYSWETEKEKLIKGLHVFANYEHVVIHTPKLHLDRSAIDDIILAIPKNVYIVITNNVVISYDEDPKMIQYDPPGFYDSTFDDYFSTVPKFR